MLSSNYTLDWSSYFVIMILYGYNEFFIISFGFGDIINYVITYESDYGLTFFYLKRWFIAIDLGIGDIIYSG